MDEAASLPRKLLLVEDDQELLLMMQEFLQDEGYRVRTLQRGDEVMQSVATEQPDLLVLDMMLPGIDGLEVCRQIRKNYHFPVLILTARDDDLLEVASLREGADNYLIKPVRPHVLLAHIQAIFRREEAQRQTSSTALPFQVQDIRLEPDSCRVFFQGEELAVSQGEFRILHSLYLELGRPVSRERLYQKVRGIPYDGLDRFIDLQISALRRKLDDAVPPHKYIRTIRGQGYCLLP